ncbi:hypothetical protein [Actinocrispum wychmicini]|uniref:Phage integrase family protein n=1 Tax=Actinocrispum wychmicini TaxID=1213861 RepID=A0A4R2JL56_9PSEU|nr:hypothetical protein [Actinocrispum wychmicini]TCO59302.1 hypothetical protein EV192_104143 [Actinocrispum wychmicini]
MPRLRLPPTARTGGAPIDQQRLALIRRVLIDSAVPDVDRVVGLLILLYAQPLNRIARLTVDDVLVDGDDMLLRLGDPLTPVPEPFAEVLARYVAHRSNQTTATNPNSRLLFSGRRAGQPMHTTSLRLHLRNLGIPNMDSRSAAIGALLLRAPAPVVAGMLGYHVVRTEAIAADAGATWKRYAAGDHARRAVTAPSVGTPQWTRRGSPAWPGTGLMFEGTIFLT